MSRKQVVWSSNSKEGNDFGFERVEVDHFGERLAEILAQVGPCLGRRDLRCPPPHGRVVDRATLPELRRKRSQPDLGHSQLRGQVGDCARERLRPLIRWMAVAGAVGGVRSEHGASDLDAFVRCDGPAPSRAVSEYTSGPGGRGRTVRTPAGGRHGRGGWTTIEDRIVPVGAHLHWLSRHRLAPALPPYQL